MEINKNRHLFNRNTILQILVLVHCYCEILVLVHCLQSLVLVH